MTKGALELGPNTCQTQGVSRGQITQHSQGRLTLTTGVLELGPNTCQTQGVNRGSNNTARDGSHWP